MNGHGEISFFIPEIRGKGRPRFFKGIAVTDSKTRQYENLVKMLALQAREKAGIVDAIDLPMCAQINAYFEIPKSYSKKKIQAIIDGQIKPSKPDIDNIVKSVLDGCNKVIFKDDVQIYSLTANKNFVTNLKHYGVYVAFKW